MLVYPQSQEVYPVGSVIQTKAPPSNRWERCYGQVVAQADYPILYNKMKNPHSLRWNTGQTVLLFPDGECYYTILTDGTNYVVIGPYSIIGYSTDLVNWTNITPVTGSWYSGAYGNGIFMVIGYGSTAAAVSINGGVDWTAKTLPQSKYWMHCCWDGTYFWAAATNYNKICYSTNGNSWTEINTVTTATSGWLGYEGMASDGAGTIVVYHNSRTLGVSTDNGSTWTVQPFVSGVSGVSFANNKFIISTEGGFVLVSDDGLSWEQHQMFSSDEQYFYFSSRQSIISKWRYENGMYIGFGGLDGSTKTIFYSYDLKTFEPIYPFANGEQYIYDVIWDSVNERLVFFNSSDGYVSYLNEFGYDETTYFQFPYVFGDHTREHGKEWYIRVR